MSIIKQPLLYVGSQGEKHLYTVFDSGRFAVATNLSCINPEHVPDLAHLESLGRVRRVATAAVGNYIEIKHRVTLDFYLQDVVLSDEFLVVPRLSEDAIIGAATMQKWRIKLDFEHDTIHVDPKVAKMQLI